jgi:hypothetical protein
MPAVWPSTLPEYVLADAFKEALNTQTIESATDTGSVKVRRRYTKLVRKFDIAVLLSEAQLATFETFWLDTLRGGALSFDWVHPLKRTAVTFRFRSPAPSYANVGGVYTRASFTLETV